MSYAGFVRGIARWNARKKRYEESPISHPDRISVYDPDSDESLQAAELMIQNGWCTHQARYLATVFDRDALEELARVKRNSERRADHALCASRPACIAYNIDMGNYQTQHTSPNCKCGDISVPTVELTSVLRSGSVPLLSITTDDCGVLGLQLHRRKRRSSYTAISHVWADGLGNPRSNGLPACQMLKLKHRLDVLQKGDFSNEKRLFWMDTLCIPVQDEYHDLRQWSIRAMASIYAGARTVLVLDAELMQLKEKECNWMARILSSVWMCRSWTLQEAVLSQDCAFQFADSIVARKGFEQLWRGGITEPWVYNFDQSFGRWMSFRATDDEPRPFDESSVDTPNNRRYDEFLATNMFYIRKKKRCLHNQLVMTWNALAGRSTTQQDDLYLIFANVLDLYIDSLINVSTINEKLERIIFSQEYLPLSFFFNTGKRSLEPGPNRWVPAEISRDIMQPSPCLEFNPETATLKLREWSDTKITVYKGSKSISPAVTRFCLSPVDETRDYLVEALSTEADKQYGLGHDLEPCVIIDKCSSVHDQQRGAIFSIISHDNMAIRLDFFCPARVTPIPQAPQPVELQVPARKLDRHVKLSVNYTPKPDLKKRRPPYQSFDDVEKITAAIGVMAVAFIVYFISFIGPAVLCGGNECSRLKLFFGELAIFFGMTGVMVLFNRIMWWKIRWDYVNAF